MEPEKEEKKKKKKKKTRQQEQKRKKETVDTSIYLYPPAPWGHQAVRDILETSSYRLDDLSLKTDGWYLYECCFPAPWNKAVTFPDVRCLNSRVLLATLPSGTRPLPPPMYVA